MKIKLVNIKDAEKLTKEIQEVWPLFLPKPQFEVLKELECDLEDKFIVVSDKPLKIDGDCVYLWSKPDPQQVIIRAIELAYAQTEKVYTRRSFISGKQYEKMVTSPRVTDSCLAPLGCSQCISSCPYSAIQKVEGKIYIDYKRCTNCGLCSASCPIGAIEPPLLNWSSITVISKTVKKDKITISCDPEIGDIVVPCIGYLGVEEISVLSSRFNIDLVCPNEKCINRKAAEHALQIFNSFKVKEKVELNLVGVKRNDYIKAVNNLKLSGESEFDIHAYKVNVNDSCTLCGVCSRKCPTNALKIVYSEKIVKLVVEPHRCVGCNYCVKVCKEDAIRVSKVNNYEYLKEDYSYVASEDEIAFCKRCGKPIDSKRMIVKVAKVLGKDPEELMYCNSCKQEMTAERILKSWVDRFGEIRRGK